MTAMNKTIDLIPYLPAQPKRKPRKTLHDIATLIGLLVESAVTVGIGLCLLTGVCVFLSIV